MIDRVEKDRGDAHVTPFKLGQYLKQAKDWKIWFFASNFGLSAVVTYSVAYFLPIILKEDLGFSLVLSQCLSAPVSDMPGKKVFQLTLKSSVMHSVAYLGSLNRGSRTSI